MEISAIKSLLFSFLCEILQQFCWAEKLFYGKTKVSACVYEFWGRPFEDKNKDGEIGRVFFT